MLEPEVVCSAELVLLVLLFGSSYALPSWHHHPDSQKMGNLWWKFSVARTSFANPDPDKFCNVSLDADPHIKSWIRISSIRQNCLNF